ncbi:PucR family transcriptional regulator [Pseudoclavibacter sp. RFBJ3]|uniref:PucR family transcriptional regulator n=1 Tax=unclassified Pseudoclavibacter TaxID=2615177 RepID=UPI000CE78126|nr:MULTISPECIES: helix-turn-helix domain-containing protein [unclassified Pseudoclavibacter]MBF4549503.1 helix-turn-helix domain-containing protein [Pseudoclavibacter sp. VKM Ac-2888]PPF40008.1 PucR family transcriptional regulator [Pseudoclavibacter sp. AY1H1]PPF75990.1 PucR family transcriptional regulator [Pseudoclavibacter sp. Z016]PPF84915.1 PucR family transcriptional regulator [Pseudoclavibacter sp. RFBJ5]PPF93919.1 PucR family transcriptional regulator [Pseudoclavibacter sp. RFBJ3]
MPAPRTKEQTLNWLRSISGELSTATVKRLEDTLPWFGDMPPGRRSAVGLVAQSGISSFIAWFEDPTATPWVAADVFDSAPRELLRSVSLQQTLQLIRVVVEVVEERTKLTDGDVREAVLKYSRDIAFAAADVYARAAEARGLWDARLEALVVDSILTGEHDDELPSRIAALGWHGHGEVSVLVGTTPRILEVDQIRRTARHNKVDLLVGVQGGRLVLVIGRAHPTGEGDEGEQVPFMEIAERLEPSFGDGRLVLGPPVPSVVEASRSARAALAGFAVAGAWRKAQRPMLADELLPERALAGDPLARQTLVARVFRPLADHQSDLLTTLWCYLDNGRSLEATARELFVHPNTVRYRLKRVSEVIGWDATGPREALILQCALILGNIAEPKQPEPRRQSGGTPASNVARRSRRTSH